MKELLYFILPGCPYCKRTNKYINELYNENPEYKKIPIKVIDESKAVDFSNSYDYYYVPTIFCGSKKLLEGIVTKSEVNAAFEYALAE